MIEPNINPGNHLSNVAWSKSETTLANDNPISAVIINANLMISQPVPAKNPPTTG